MNVFQQNTLFLMFEKEPGCDTDIVHFVEQIAVALYTGGYEL